VSAVVADPARADLVNVQGTQRALEAARSSDVGRFVYASTVWVYDGISTNGHLLDEDTPMRLPNHFYTATKLAGEMYCRAYSELFDLKQTTLRFGIPYGPRSRASAVVAAFVARAREGKPLEIRGDGRQSRQFVYVEDLADGVVAALQPVAAGRVYNLVGDTSTTVREIADTVREIVGNVPIVHTPERPADLRIGHVSGARAAGELGWQATTPFVDGVRRYVEWLAETSSSPVARAASSTNGSAPTVRRQESAEL
jgi:UDP-glucose 4-epimerase